MGALPSMFALGAPRGSEAEEGVITMLYIPKLYPSTEAATIRERY